MKYERVVWDFDGVLVDSRSEAWRAASEILALIGISVDIQSQETFRKYFTKDGIISKRDRETLRGMHRLIMRNRAELLEPHLCLALVARLNVPSEIVTSGSVAVAQKVLGEQAELFVNIRGQENDNKDSLLRSLTHDTIFITDTIVDIKRCRNYGVAVIAVGWGYDSTVALRNSRPDFVVESSTQLESLLAELKLLTAG